MSSSRQRKPASRTFSPIQTRTLYVSIAPSAETPGLFSCLARLSYHSAVVNVRFTYTLHPHSSHPSSAPKAQVPILPPPTPRRQIPIESNPDKPETQPAPMTTHRNSPETMHPHRSLRYARPIQLNLYPVEPLRGSLAKVLDDSEKSPKKQPSGRLSVLPLTARGKSIVYTHPPPLSNPSTHNFKQKPGGT